VSGAVHDHVSADQRDEELTRSRKQAPSLVRALVELDSRRGTSLRRRRL